MRFNCYAVHAAWIAVCCHAGHAGSIMRHGEEALLCTTRPFLMYCEDDACMYCNLNGETQLCSLSSDVDTVASHRPSGICLCCCSSHPVLNSIAYLLSTPAFQPPAAVCGLSMLPGQITHFANVCKEHTTQLELALICTRPPKNVTVWLTYYVT